LKGPNPTFDPLFEVAYFELIEAKVMKQWKLMVTTRGEGLPVWVRLTLQEWKVVYVRVCAVI
jgi:hypothetical protein